eukprot:maker-scaffold3976_size6998-snap-gene-0.0 protein:Tk07028 transcript:maker-scaffold3976_size6998-snap-gene-0.0-mRNA-1 annotation:"glutaryl- dehydrogenase protein"
METKFKDMGDHYVLNGAKMWISNAPICDVAVVWAKNEEGRIHGLIVERDAARYGIAWGVIGAAMDCYDTALRYAKE